MEAARNTKFMSGSKDRFRRKQRISLILISEHSL